MGAAKLAAAVANIAISVLTNIASLLPKVCAPEDGRECVVPTHDGEIFQSLA
jgi:hypothetical protein